MTKKSLKHKRMNGGDGETGLNGIIVQLIKSKIFGISVLNLISIFLVPGLFVGVWASQNFSTSFESIAIALLVAEFIYIGIILPIKYGYQMLVIRTTGTMKIRTWLPKMLQSWLGLLFIFLIWIGFGLVLAMGFGGLGSNYSSGVLPGIATVGIVLVLLGFIDTFLTTRKATGYSPNTLSEQLVDDDGSIRDSSYSTAEISRSKSTPNDEDLLEAYYEREDGPPSNELSDIEPSDLPYDDTRDTIGGRIHKRRRSRSNSRGKRRHK